MNLYNYCQSEGIKIDVACEVGFYRLKDSQIKDFIYSGIKCIVVDILQSRVATRYKNVEWHRVGIGFKEGLGTFLWNGASTHHIGILSPSVQNNSHKKKYKGTINHKCITFDRIDKGDIDLLCIDIEGLEYAVLKFMKSKPKVIAVEMKWRKYKNPYFKNIRAWMRYHGYTFVTVNTSDEIYRRTA